MSLLQILASFRSSILGTWLLVLVEAGLTLLFPLALGLAIDGLLRQAYSGLYLLAGLGCAAVVVGSVRRLYDTRVYSRIFVEAGAHIVREERGRDSNVSVVSARTDMAKELVDFFENSFPAIIDCVIGLVGALAMIWFLEASVFTGCLIATAVIVAIYGVTTSATYSLNKGVNHESEKQVRVLSSERMPEVDAHFRRLTSWNIRLSDLETVNFGLSWTVMIVVLVYAVAATVQAGLNEPGRVLALLTYVFAYIECVVASPMYYQQIVRLGEISERLEPNANLLR